MQESEYACRGGTALAIAQPMSVDIETGLTMFALLLNKVETEWVLVCPNQNSLVNRSRGDPIRENQTRSAEIFIFW